MILLERLSTLDYTDIADLRKKVIEIAESIIEAAADNSAALAAEFYDLVRVEAIGKPIGAVAAPMWEPEAFRGSVRALVQDVVNGATVESFYNSIVDRADYTIKKSAGDCVAKNSARDKKNRGYARVPTGFETCDFCIMLASRGNVYHTSESAGAIDHYHSKCDCRVTPWFDGMAVSGYDPDKLFDQYLAGKRDSAAREKEQGVKKTVAPKTPSRSALAKKGDSIVRMYSPKNPYQDILEAYLLEAANEKELNSRARRVYDFYLSHFDEDFRKRLQHRMDDAYTERFFELMGI